MHEAKWARGIGMTSEEYTQRNERRSRSKRFVKGFKENQCTPNLKKKESNASRTEAKNKET